MEGIRLKQPMETVPCPGACQHTHIIIHAYLHALCPKINKSINSEYCCLLDQLVYALITLILITVQIKEHAKKHALIIVA